MIRVTQITVPESAYSAVYGVLRSGQLAQGPQVEALESTVAGMSGAAHAVAVHSGTAALQLAVESVCEPGSRVAVPALTFAASAYAILHAGCFPVVVDIKDRMLDVGRLPDVDAVMPVYLFGQRFPCDVNVPVVEDACQAVGQPISHGAVSLYATKMVGCGEGGVFVTDDPLAAERARLVRNQGMAGPYDHRMPGRNLRLTDLQAAVANSFLETLDERLERRREVAHHYLCAFAGLDVELPSPDGHLFHQFVVEVDDRDRVRRELAADGVETVVHYPYVLSEWFGGETPNAARFITRCLSLPVHENLADADVERVADSFVRATRR